MLIINKSDAKKAFKGLKKQTEPTFLFADTQEFNLNTNKRSISIVSATKTEYDEYLKTAFNASIGIIPLTALTNAAVNHDYLFNTFTREELQQYILQDINTFYTGDKVLETDRPGAFDLNVLGYLAFHTEQIASFKREELDKFIFALDYEASTTIAVIYKSDGYQAVYRVNKKQYSNDPISMHFSFRPDVEFGLWINLTTGYEGYYPYLSNWRDGRVAKSYGSTQVANTFTDFEQLLDDLTRSITSLNDGGLLASGSLDRPDANTARDATSSIKDIAWQYYNSVYTKN